MYKLASVLLCVVATLTGGDATVLLDSSEIAAPISPDVIAQVASIIKTTCPEVCKAVNQMCTMNPDVLSCAEVLNECNGLCTNLEKCIGNSATKCAEYESNCKKLGSTPSSGTYCSLVADVCEVATVYQCNQNLVANLLTEVISNVAISLQGVINVILSQTAA